MFFFFHAFCFVFVLFPCAIFCLCPCIKNVKAAIKIVKVLTAFWVQILEAPYANRPLDKFMTDVSMNLFKTGPAWELRSLMVGPQSRGYGIREQSDSSELGRVEVQVFGLFLWRLINNDLLNELGLF